MTAPHRSCIARAPRAITTGSVRLHVDIGTRSKQVLMTAAGVVMVLIAGCGVMNLEAASVRNPMTPEQSKAQVVDAAREIVRALNLHVLKASFAHSSCNDQGDPPFHGEMMIAYPLAPSFESAESENAEMVQRLQSLGWTGDPALHSHGPVLKKQRRCRIRSSGCRRHYPGYRTARRVPRCDHHQENQGDERRRQPHVSAGEWVPRNGVTAPRAR